MKRLKKILFLLPPVLLAACFLADPATGKDAAARGLLLCGRVIIPSLFPFTVCVLLAVKCGFAALFSPLSPLSRRIFRLPGEHLALLLLSMLGGYPIGAKLLNRAVREERLSKENASLLLCASVNAGPAFVVLTVGNGLFSSALVGGILLFGHLASSLLLSVLIGFFLKKETAPPPESSTVSFADSFVSSVTEAASAVFNICAYVVFFSVVTVFWNRLFQNIPLLANCSFLLEITCGISQTRHLYFISFLLGFAGLSVWCQVFSLAGDIPLRPGLFFMARVLHGAFSAFFTFCLTRLFPVAIQTAARTKTVYTYDNFGLSLAMLAMSVIFLLSLFPKLPLAPENP